MWFQQRKPGGSGVDSRPTASKRALATAHRMPSFSVAILTVSDSAFKASSTSSPSADASGPALRNLLSSLPASPYTVVSSAIVPDDPSEISRVVKVWCEADVNLVLTTGGTGFGLRDRTPEVRFRACGGVGEALTVVDPTGAGSADN